MKNLGESRKIAAYFSNYIPPEIIAAAGFHPLRIIGCFGTAGSQPLPRPICSFVQDVFAAASNGMFADLGAILFPNSCDSLKALRQNWNIASVPVLTLNHPINTDSHAAAFMADQLRRLASDLQQLNAANYSQAALRQSVTDYNRARHLLRRLYTLRSQGAAGLKYSDLSAVVTAGFIMDCTEYVNLLTHLTEHLSENTPEAVPGSRILVAGPLVDHYALLAKIEERGGIIVDDDVTNGRRYCNNHVSEEGDLYEKIATSLLANASPSLNAPSAETAFENRIRESAPDKVIFINQKHCEPHVHSCLEKKEFLDRMGIPHLIMHVEHAQTRVQADDLLRLESFLEMPAGQ